MTTPTDLPPAESVPAAHGALARRTWPGAGDAADRSALVVLPGLDGASDSFAPLAASLGGRRTMHGLDLRGRGAAEVAGPWTVAGHADDVVAVLEAGAAPVVLAGHSYGAHVAAEVARRRPDLVERLVLLDGGTPRRLAPDADRAAVAAMVASNIVPHLAAKPFAVDADAVAADSHSLFCDPEANEAVFSVAVPVTMVRAELGVAPGLPPVVPTDAVEELAGAIGAGAVTDVLVEGADHFTVVGDPSGALVEALLR